MKWAELDPDFGGTSKKKALTKGGKVKTKLSKKHKKFDKKSLKSLLKNKFGTRSRRNVWMTEQDKSRSNRWNAIREGVVSAYAQQAQDVPTDEWEDIPKAELGDRGEKGKLVGRTFQQGGAKDFISGQKRVYKKETTGPRGVHWRGAYTGKKILHSGDIEVDHIVPVFRAAASERFNDKFTTLKQKQEFVANSRNLVVATKEGNQAKGGYGLAKWKPPLESARPDYAEAYHKVFENYGMKMTIGEAQRLQVRSLQLDYGMKRKVIN